MMPGGVESWGPGTLGSVQLTIVNFLIRVKRRELCLTAHHLSAHWGWLAWGRLWASSGAGGTGRLWPALPASSLALLCTGMPV